MTILILDSLDKCGKDTIIEKLHKKTNYKHIILNRFIGSNYCYGKFHKRKLNFDEYLNYDKQLSELKFIKQIILVCDKKVLIKRFKKHNEKDIQIEDIDKLTKLYDEYCQISRIPTLLVDTTRWTAEKCATKILNWLEKQEK